MNTALLSHTLRLWRLVRRSASFAATPPASSASA